MSVTGAGLLQERKNTEVERELNKTGFCEGSRGYSCMLTIVSVRRAFTVVSAEDKGLNPVQA